MFSSQHLYDCQLRPPSPQHDGLAIADAHETTLVHWGGEIGRLPVSEGNLDASAGRNHNGQGFSIWLAGGGIKGGQTFGTTDDVGHRAVENIVTPNDFQATILHLFGLDHTRLIYHANGREQRLTDGRPARVVKEILRTRWKDSASSSSHVCNCGY